MAYLEECRMYPAVAPFADWAIDERREILDHVALERGDGDGTRNGKVVITSQFRRCKR